MLRLQQRHGQCLAAGDEAFFLVAERILDFADTVELSHKCIQAGRIEKPAALLVDIVEGFLHFPAGFVRAFRGQRVVGVRDADNARGQWYFLATEFVRITGAVEAFVVAQRNDGALSLIHISEPTRR